MTPRITRSHLGVAWGLCLGCSAAPQAPAPVPDEPATYFFREQVPDGGGLIVEGTFTVLGGTVSVQAAWARCVEDPDPRGMVIRYECGAVRLSFNRNDPVREAWYAATVTLRSRETRCTQWGGPNQQQCLRSTTDVVERDVVRSGRLNAKRTT